MDRTDLRRLLREADAAVRPPPDPPADLLTRVKGFQRRRRMVRHAAGTAVVVAGVVLAGGIWVARDMGHVATTPIAAMPPPQPRAARGALEADLRALEQRVAVHERTVQKLLAREIRQQDARNRQRLRDLSDPRARIEAQLSIAAYDILREAELNARVRNQPGPAVAAYRRVIELFPSTEWAEVARHRLRQIGS